MSEEKKRQHYRFNKPISPIMFQRRDELRKWADEAHEDIMAWVRTLNWNGKLVGVDPNKIKSIELLGSRTVIIVHEVKNWRQFADDDETSIQTTKIDAEDFFYPNIVKDEPQQLDMDDIEHEGAG